jgi:serine/threonine protein kinase
VQYGTSSPPDTEQQLQDALRDGYRVERELGAGGMGTVYLAEDLRHRRKVAIKVLRPEVAASMGAERFAREIHIAAALQHPNILSLIDSGAAGTLLYYVMPYVEGSTLRARLAREGELPIDEGLRLLREIAEALAYAHGRGIVHRDLKPENVLFMAGHAQLADFGVAKALGDLGVGMAVTEGGVVLGSPGYMAPEAASGDSATDHRADIYAFGVLGYETLAGQHPFPATGHRQMILAHLTRDPQPLEGLRPSVSAELNGLIMRCLEKRPADRWQSAAEIARHLDAMLAGSGATALRERTHDVAARRFRLTEAVCGRLRRSSFNPKMIGDEVEYLDNGARSDVLVCFVHAIGLDGADFEPHLRMLPYRGIAPTLYGFEPSRRRPPPGCATARRRSRARCWRPRPRTDRRRSVPSSWCSPTASRSRRPRRRNRPPAPRSPARRRRRAGSRPPWRRRSWSSGRRRSRRPASFSVRSRRRWP